MFEHVKYKFPSKGTFWCVYSFGEDSYFIRNNKAIVVICLYNSRHAWLYSEQVPGDVFLHQLLSEKGETLMDDIG